MEGLTLKYYMDENLSQQKLKGQFDIVTLESAKAIEKKQHVSDLSVCLCVFNTIVHMLEG